MSARGINYVLGTMAPDLVTRLQSISVPEVTGDYSYFKYTFSSTKLSGLRMEKPTVTLMEGRGMNLRMKGFRMKVHVHYNIEGSDWYNPLYSGGYISCVLTQKDDLSGDLDIGMTDEGHPKVGLQVSNVAFEMSDFQVQGSWFSNSIETLAGLFQEHIEGLIADKVKTVMQHSMNRYMQDYFNSIPMMLQPPLKKPYDGVQADLTLCEVHVGSDCLYFGLMGAFVQARPSLLEGASEPLPVVQPSYPHKPRQLDAAPPSALRAKMMAITFSNFTLNSCLWIYQMMGMLHTTITPNDLPLGAGVDFSAKTARNLVPSVMVPRGLNSDFVCEITSTSPPNIWFDAGGIQIDGEVEMALRWTEQSERMGTFLKFKAPVSAVAVTTVSEGEEEEAVEVHVKSLSCTPIEILGGDGTADEPGINALTEMLCRVALGPYFQSFIGKGFALSESHGLRLTRSNMDFGQGLMTATSDLSVDLKKFDSYIDRMMGV